LQEEEEEDDDDTPTIKEVTMANRNTHRSQKDNIIKKTVLRIYEILVWIRIRIRESIPVTNGSGFGSGFWIRILLFSSLNFKMTTKY
jgi:hypothetical protein